MLSELAADFCRFDPFTPAKPGVKDTNSKSRTQLLRPRRRHASRTTKSQKILCPVQPQSVVSSDMSTSSPNKYSVILPTYNERQNLPVIVQMLSDVFTKE